MEWAKAFVETCLELRLSGIAITDHHDFCFVPYVQKALSEIDGPDRPWLFPGVEVTCQDAVQCLVLFDADTAADLWNRMFGGHLQNIDVPDPNAATNPQAEECGKAVADFISGIASDTILKNAAIVLPHASNDGAHKSMLRQGFSARFKTLPFDGVYTDKSFQSLDGGTKRKIYGEVLEWGSRRRGIVPTGDNRTADFRRLGAHTCWVRLGEPTAEAIRQAVLADVARFSYEVPTLPAQRIVCLKVHSALTGDNFRVHFNDGFTALIGGRGSGKSALLEYLRFALGRSAVDTATEGESGRDREESLLSTTLANGSVSVVLERDGVVETWSRHWKSREHIQVIVGEEVVDELTPEMAQRRFRARAFYQKQLSTLVSDRKSAADQITGIAAAEFVDQRRLLERDVAAAQRGVLAGFQRVVEFWVAEAEHRQHKATIADLQRRLASIKNKLAEEGLSAEHTSILEAAPSYKAASTLMEEISEKLSDDIVSIDELLLNMQSLNVAQWEDLAAFPEVGAMIESIRATKRKVVLGMRAAQSSLEELEMKQEELARTFSTRKSAFDEKHKEASAQQDSLRSLVEEQSRLVDELQSAIAAERKSAVRYEKLNEAPAELKVARDNLSESVDKLSAVLEGAAERVEAMSEGSLRASVISEEVPEQYCEALRVLGDGANVHNLQGRCEARVAELVDGQREETWTEVCDVFLDILRMKIQQQVAKIEQGDDVYARIAKALGGEFTERQVNLIYGKIDQSAIGKMLTAVVDDFVEFEYRDATGFIPFAHASPGQQAAALLQLLLNQEAGTLIVDQPEDDLDNRVVTKIAQVLQTTKRKRQLIFSTHNPNFVVNGDADKIVALSPGHAEGTTRDSDGPRVSIEVDGAIETLPVRAAITETMEGGAAAFELRSRKYSFRQ